ncbi:uncharacterized protein [Oryza sativa Japonica Group]|uniref:uncharacterized protein n=1 Tax=Oryza sativa subsp. japonica TaxID=39947 RepID=UPI00339D21F4
MESSQSPLPFPQEIPKCFYGNPFQFRGSIFPFSGEDPKLSRVFPVVVRLIPSSRAYIKDPLVVLYLSPQVPSVVVAGIALPALAFSLHLRPPLQQPCAVAVVVAFGRRCRGWVHEEEKKTGLHFPVAEDVWKYLTDVNPSFAAAGRWSSRTSPSPRSSPSCAATSLGSARSRASPAAGSLASKTPGSPSSPSTRSSPSRFDLRQGLAAPSVIAKLCRSLPRHRSCEVNLVHPSVASVRRRKIVAAVDSTSPPFEARRRPSSVAVCRRVSVACRFRRFEGSQVRRKCSRRLIEDRVLQGKLHRSQTQFL